MLVDKVIEAAEGRPPRSVAEIARPTKQYAVQLIAHLGPRLVFQFGRELRDLGTAATGCWAQQKLVTSNAPTSSLEEIVRKSSLWAERAA